MDFHSRVCLGVFCRFRAVEYALLVARAGAGAMLEVALISWAMQRVAAAGFTLHGTPDLVRAAVLEKCGFQPRGDNTQVQIPSPPPPSCTCPRE